MKNILTTLIFVLSLNIISTAQQRPLLTDDIDITPPGAIEISAGADFIQDAKFPLSGLTGDLTRVGDIRIKTGFASNVEIQIEGVIQEYLAINSQSINPPIPLNVLGNSTSDYGDIQTSVKVKLRNETENLPALGFKFGFQLPNTDQSRGIGTNQINIFSKIIVQKTFGKQAGQDPKLKLYCNLGLGIQTAPLERFTQNDVLLYGLAGIYRVNDSINIAGEVNGQISTRSGAAPLGTESKGQFRIGTQIKTAGLRFDTAAILGLTKFSPRSGITFGVTYQTPQIFTPAQ